MFQEQMILEPSDARQKGYGNCFRKSLIPWTAVADLSLGQNDNLSAPARAVSKGEGSGPRNRLDFEGGPWTHFAVPKGAFWCSPNRKGAAIAPGGFSRPACPRLVTAAIPDFQAQKFPPFLE
jgi:hypothetical protein